MDVESTVYNFLLARCYLDAACIHLGQGDLFERGIYSIAGCLSVASELRVLYSELPGTGSFWLTLWGDESNINHLKNEWETIEIYALAVFDPFCWKLKVLVHCLGQILSKFVDPIDCLYPRQYLSSLWCLFELVGYRKAKPEGKLVFKPLFIERSVTMTALFMWCFALSINFVLSFTGESFRSEYIGVLYLLVFSLPLILIVHAMRRNYREKENLIFDLSNFELDRSLDLV